MVRTLSSLALTVFIVIFFSACSSGEKKNTPQQSADTTDVRSSTTSQSAKTPRSSDDAAEVSSDDESSQEKFDVFIKRFFSDEAFQLSRLNETMISAYLGDCNPKERTTTKKADWKFWDGNVEGYPPIVSNEEKNGEMYHTRACRDCGAIYVLVFAMQDGKYFLTAVNDYSC